jgi:hypothetical protein
MTLPNLDPHPHGCPLGIAATPDEMPEVIRGVCHKLRDLLYPSIHVVNPSRGESYPILNLYDSDAATRARVVLFPGWESKVRSRRRRIRYGRQAMLLGRIADAGVGGEAVSVDSAPDPDSDAPLELSLACTADQIPERLRDLYTYLGDRVRLTVTTLASRQAEKGWPHLRVVRLYSPFNDTQPRVVFLPLWAGVVERPTHMIDAQQNALILREAARRDVEEVEVEDFPATTLRA